MERKPEKKKYSGWERKRLKEISDRQQSSLKCVKLDTYFSSCTPLTATTIQPEVVVSQDTQIQNVQATTSSQMQNQGFETQDNKGLAFRGHRESQGLGEAILNEGNFLELIKLISKKDDLLKQHLLFGDRNATYLSPDMGSNLYSLTQNTIEKRTIIEHIGGSQNLWIGLTDEAVEGQFVWDLDQSILTTEHRKILFPYTQSMNPIQFTQYKAVDDTNVTMLPINVEFDQVSLLSCAHLCSSSNKTCYSYIYNNITRLCSLGSWLVPLKASQKKVEGKIFSSGKFCNTTRNITVLSDGSISDTDRLFCQSEIRPLVTLSSGLQVMCDTVTDGGGWTIFQRRVSGTVDFYRNWTEYKNGFGDFSLGNFYLGNENIYLLTSNRQTELRVDMIFNEKKYFAKYSSFNISSESDGYRLHVGGFTGDAMERLSYHNGMMFTTFDRDNDVFNTNNCALTSKGAWWFRDCLSCHLNAVWGTANLYWNPNSIATFSEMKFRPI
ncbi:angiopoietin-2-like [Physella acuta]|uniref:angiopoietin-2-like n=1 Tax=Physella acuta TaxID=109671 RepID=UPI0027DABAED|nr:angiopoietin-2-like [Physella acuta]